MESPEFSFCSPENRLSGDHFVVEDLLDFSNDVDDDRVLHHGFTPGNSTDSASTVVDSCNSSFSGGVGGGGCDTPFAGAGGFGGDGHFSSDDLGVPYDDMAQLEWLSNFVEESFSSDDLKIKTQPDPNPEPNSDPSFLISDPTRPNTTTPLPGKARSKRSRSGPGNWISRLLVVTPETTSSQKPKKKPMSGSGSGSRSDQDPNGEIRRCLHCATDKTPQWRTGPMGPKTLCNACGVRYKSGRLVPEYRPASSPTFVLTKHSNSHRKVMELRRQKEVQRQQVIREQLIRDPSMGFDPNNNTGGGGGGDGYLIHHHMGPDFRQLI